MVIWIDERAFAKIGLNRRGRLDIEYNAEAEFENGGIAESNSEGDVGDRH